MALPRTVLRAQGGCRICPGSHLALDHLGTPLDAAASKHLALAHFPVRSVEQITRKIAGGWLSDSLDRARRGDSPSGASFQWKAILDELTSGKQLTSDDLTRIALSYATVEQWNSLPQSFTQGTIDRFVLHQNDAATAPVAAGPVMRDPIETTSLLRYPHRPVTALAVLLKSTEDLTEEYIRLTTQRTADR